MFELHKKWRQHSGPPISRAVYDASPSARGFAEGREQPSEVDVDQGRKARTAVKTWIGERGCYHSLLPSVTSRAARRRDGRGQDFCSTP
jgi:hypothetical protein